MGEEYKDYEYLSAQEVAERMKISEQRAYTCIRLWNRKLAEQGFHIRRGKIQKEYFESKFFRADRDGQDCFKRIDFNTMLSDSDDEPITGTETHHTVLYNTNVISEDEVREIIRNGTFQWDNRIIHTQPDRADAFLKGIIPEKERGGEDGK